MLTIHDIDLHHKRVLIREDLNVPLDNGVITSDARIRATLPTIQLALEQDAAIMLMSHLGRPIEGQFDAKFSLAPVAERLSELLQQPVCLVQDWLDGVDVKLGTVVLCENVRFNPGEKADDDGLAKKMAALCDVFIMDAFATAHRAQASTHGVAKFAPVACAGPLLQAELNALQKVLHKPQRPLTAIIGGSKVSSKLILLNNLTQVVDQLIVGGGIANTFLAAQGYNIGQSLYEPNLIDTAKQLLNTLAARDAQLPLPTDVVTAKQFTANAQAKIKTIDAIEDDDRILDIGPETAQHYASLLTQSETIVWNGPVGVFEWDTFSQGTQILANAIANSTAFSVAGGGDTLAAIDKFSVSNKISYISTGGGAFLELLSGETLPGVTVLQRSN